MTEHLPSTPRSRYRRDRRPPGMVLQLRDLELLAFVAEVRFATRDQLAAMFFGDRSAAAAGQATTDGLVSAKHRLQKLWQHRYLHRHHVVGVWNRRGAPTRSLPSSPAVYSLSDRGASAVAEHRGLDFDAVAYERKPADLSASFIVHELAATELRVAWSRAVPAALTWLPARAALHRYELETEEGPTVKQFAPDGYARLELDGPLHCFVEIDRGTQSVQHRIRRKVADYAAYATSGAFAARYLDRPTSRGRRGSQFRVLFVTTQTDQRLASLKLEVERHGHRAFWFTTLARLRAAWDPLADPIWQRAGRTGWHPFWRRREEYFSTLRPLAETA